MGIRVWLADELGMVKDLTDQENRELGDHRKIYEQQEILQDTGDADMTLMKETVRKIQESTARVDALSEIRDHRERLACTQAKLGLDGPKMPMNTLAWRDLNDGGACVAAGSQDQLVRVFRIDT